MEVSLGVWLATIAFIVALLAFDFFAHVRHAHAPSLKEAAIWSAVYVSIAILFGIGILVFGGPEPGAEYFAGYLTEKALSVDNLFVFVIIIGSFAVPRAEQQKVLLFGIVIALIARTVFIFLGAALIENLSWVFYIFGAILVLTAVNLLRPGHNGPSDNIAVRIAKRFMKTSDHYDGDRLTTMVDGKRMLTPMLLVMVAIGGTDILFALDSVPAIYGLTENVFIVFTATAFSLLGLRQLYFLIDGLLDRLIYLAYGLAAILAFIGVKLVIHALHVNELPFINGGRGVPIPEIPTLGSLLVIVGILVVTIVLSLLSPAGRARSALSTVRRHATTVLDATEGAATRDRAREGLDAEVQRVRADERTRAAYEDDPALQELVAKATAAS